MASGQWPTEKFAVGQTSGKKASGKKKNRSVFHLRKTDRIEMKNRGRENERVRCSPAGFFFACKPPELGIKQCISCGHLIWQDSFSAKPPE
jgi:hypothetical protein